MQAVGLIPTLVSKGTTLGATDVKHVVQLCCCVSLVVLLRYVGCTGMFIVSCLVLQV